MDEERSRVMGGEDTTSRVTGGDIAEHEGQSHRHLRKDKSDGGVTALGTKGGAGKRASGCFHGCYAGPV